MSDGETTGAESDRAADVTPLPGSTGLADHYESLWNSARERLIVGNTDIEPLPQTGDMRWGASIIFRPDNVTRTSLIREIEALKTLAGPCHASYAADTLHSTIMSVGPYRADARACDANIRILSDVLAKVAAESTAFRNEYRGIVGTNSSVLAQGWPGDDGLQALRGRLKIELECAGVIGYPDKSRMRTTSHASLLLFETAIEHPAELVSYIDAGRDRPFGAFLVENVELVSFERRSGNVHMHSYSCFPMKRR